MDGLDKPGYDVGMCLPMLNALLSQLAANAMRSPGLARRNSLRAMAIASKQSYCAQQVRQFDHDRYLCALFLPDARREAVYAIFAFNAELARIREVVSEPLLGQMRLQWWRESIGRLYGGGAASHPVLDALAPVIGGADLSRRRFERLVDARERELAGEPPPSLAALDAHADDTGGALAALTTDALGVHAAVPQLAARRIGAAWALLWIVRALAGAGRAQQIYLPADSMRDAGLDPASVIQRQPSPALEAVVEQVCAHAGTHLAAARAMRPAVPRAARKALLVARLADAVGADLRRARYDPFRLRPIVSGRIRRLLWASLLGRY